MRTLNPFRFGRALARPPARSAGAETVYADAPLARVLMAIERRASDIEQALAGYVRARRAAGVQPETVIVEFKRVMRRAAGLDTTARSPATSTRDDDARRLTHRLIELYFAV
jgi:hypothetical protein